MIVRTGRDLSLRNILYPNVSGYLFIHKCPWESFGPRGQVATCPVRNILCTPISRIPKCPRESFGPHGQVATCPYGISFTRIFPAICLFTKAPGFPRPVGTGRDLSLRNILYPNISGYLFIHKGAGIPSARTGRSRPALFPKNRHWS
jgi:hypothetical protein